MKFLVFFQHLVAPQQAQLHVYKKTIVEIRPSIKVHSHCSARFSRSTKNVQNRVFLQISDQIPKGFKWYQLFENMIAGPPSKLISFFQNNCCSILGKSNKQRVSYDAFFTVLFWFRCSSASWNRYQFRWKSCDFDEIWPGKEVSLFGVKNEDYKKSMLRSIREALVEFPCHHGFMYTRLYSQILEHSKVFLGDIGLSHWPLFGAGPLNIPCWAASPI